MFSIKLKQNGFHILTKYWLINFKTSYSNNAFNKHVHRSFKFKCCSHMFFGI